MDETRRTDAHITPPGITTAVVARSSFAKSRVFISEKCSTCAFVVGAHKQATVDQQ